VAGAGQGTPDDCVAGEVTPAERNEAYLKLLDLPSRTRENAAQSALLRAHELRKFEIENYWRRATYFWGFQLVAFAALALSSKEGIIFLPMVLPVAILGAVTALAGIMTAKGSKFWQENWEGHVDFLEDKFEGRLHKIALVKVEEGKQPSVSNVNERLLWALLSGWLIIFIAAAVVLAFPRLMQLSAACAAIVQIGLSSVALICGLVWIWKSRRSKLLNRAYELDTLQTYTGL
jgi:hypothetical protein